MSRVSSFYVENVCACWKKLHKLLFYQSKAYVARPFGASEFWIDYQFCVRSPHHQNQLTISGKYCICSMANVPSTDIRVFHTTNGNIQRKCVAASLSVVCFVARLVSRCTDLNARSLVFLEICCLLAIFKENFHFQTMKKLLQTNHDKTKLELISV